MMGAKSLHAESGAKPDQETSFAGNPGGPRHAGSKARRWIGAITGYFSGSQPQPPGLYLPLVRVDREH